MTEFLMKFKITVCWSNYTFQADIEIESIMKGTEMYHNN